MGKYDAYLFPKNYQQYAAQFDMAQNDIDFVDQPRLGGSNTEAGLTQDLLGPVRNQAGDTQSLAIQEAAKRELQKDIGLSLLLAGTEAALQMPQDPVSREMFGTVPGVRKAVTGQYGGELGELVAQEEAGETALDPEVAQLMDQAATAGKRAAGEMLGKVEATMAAGGSGSAGDIQRAQQSAMQTAAKSAREAGLEKARMEYGARQERRQKIDQMKAQMREEVASRRSAAAQSIAKGALLFGKLRGEKPLEVADIQGLVDQGFTNEQIMDIYEQSNKTMSARDKFFENLIFSGSTEVSG